VECMGAASKGLQRLDVAPPKSGTHSGVLPSGTPEKPGVASMTTVILGLFRG
jgi:hypothetical protein